MHLIRVTEAEETGQSIPSIVILTSVGTLENPVPENEISSPPVTDPYLGWIELSLGVLVAV
jgi:hypothetical protein